MLSEPISPELVLVDPELARVARAALPEPPPPVERARLAPVPTPVEPPRPAPGPSVLSELPPPPLPLPLPSAPLEYEAPPSAPRRPAWRWLLLAAAIGGLAVVVLPTVAHRVGDGLAPSGPVLAEPPAQPAPAPTIAPKPSASKPNQRSTASQPGAQTRKRQRAGATKASTASPKRRAERLVLKGLAIAGKGTVPANLLDPQTGLVKTNVQVICTPAGTSGSVFDCLARAADSRPGAGFVVGCRLLPGGHVRLSWHGYRRT